MLSLSQVVELFRRYGVTGLDKQLDMLVRNRKGPNPGWAGQDVEFSVEHTDSEEGTAHPSEKRIIKLHGSLLFFNCLGVSWKVWAASLTFNSNTLCTNIP